MSVNSQNSPLHLDIIDKHLTITRTSNDLFRIMTEPQTPNPKTPHPSPCTSTREINRLLFRSILACGPRPRQRIEMTFPSFDEVRTGGNGTVDQPRVVVGQFSVRDGPPTIRWVGSDDFRSFERSTMLPIVLESSSGTSRGCRRISDGFRTDSRRRLSIVNVDTERE